MLQRLFRPRPSAEAGRRLYASAVAQARRPELYEALGVEDRIDARFELYTLHVDLLLLRLQGAGAEAAEISQALFDTYVSALDNTLRELGVGDLSVPKKMRKLGAALYGRTRAYQAALAEDAEPGALEAAVAKAVFAGEGGDPRVGRLAAYIREARDQLSQQPIREVFDGEPRWPLTIG